FDVFLAQRNKTNTWFGITKDVPRVDRAHDSVLQEMKGPRIDVRSGIDQNEHIGLGRKNGRDAGAIDPMQSAQLNRACRHGRTGMPSADNGIRLTMLNQIDRATN